MKQLSRIYRYWVVLTGVFILLATFIVSGAILVRSWQSERDLLDAQRHLLERHVLAEYAKICEEAFLKLDNWSARQREMNELVGKSASVVIEFERRAPGAAPPPGERPDLAWKGADGVEHSRAEFLVVPLYFADRYLGIMNLSVAWKSGWSIGGFGQLGATLAGLITALLVAWVVTFVVFRRSVFAPFMEQALAMSRRAAFAEAVQMVAHDVRKPFALLRMCLATLRDTRDISTIRRVVESSLPQVDDMASDVEGMLAEILDSERPSHMRGAPHSLADLVRATVAREIDAYQGAGEVEVSYDLDAGILTRVDRVQLRRVTGNIVRNALEAMRGRGRLWIRTRRVHDRRGHFCEVCIGNSGEPIPSADVPRLFDSYFTKGKDGGTGLGLAIAKKFVTDHRGTIRCQSSAERGTEFVFTVPSSLEAVLVEPVDEALDMPDGLEMKASRGLSILVADSDAAYRAALMTLLSGLRDAGFVEQLSLHEASSSSEVLRTAERLPLDLIVIASSLGSASASGVAVIDDLRKRGNAALICLHTDSAAPSGRADVCIAKPLDAGKAMRLLASASARIVQV